MTVGMQHYLNRVQKFSVIPASAVLTEDQQVELTMRNDISWGDGDMTLIKPSRLVEIDTPDELGDLLKFLDTANVYIDLES